MSRTRYFRRTLCTQNGPSVLYLANRIPLGRLISVRDRGRISEVQIPRYLSVFDGKHVHNWHIDRLI